MTKTLSKLGIQNFLNLKKTIYQKCTANIILNGKKLNATSLRLGIGEMSTLTTLIQHSTVSLSQNNQVRKRNKTYKLKRNQLSLFTNDMNIYVENQRESTKNS